MIFSRAKLSDVLDKHSLVLVEGESVFDEIPPLEPGPMLVGFLGWPARHAINQATEKAKSEAIIFPFLVEMTNRASMPVVVFSGKSLSAPEHDLSGVVDYIVCRGRLTMVLEAPILAIIEGKDDNLVDGVGQCAAEMVAAREFNRAKGRTGTVFGCVTTGLDWMFFRLDGDRLVQHREVFPMSDPARILGTLVAIADGNVGGPPGVALPPAAGTG